MRVYGDQAQALPKRAIKIFPKFIEVFDLDLREVITKLIMALQGDDEADAGKPADLGMEEVDWEETDTGTIDGPGVETPLNRGNLGMHWDILKQYVDSS
jgi:hypothetical protein